VVVLQGNERRGDTDSSEGEGTKEQTGAKFDSEDLFDLLSKFQGNRLDDQRCMMPKTGSSQQTVSSYRLESILRCPPPYPMVVLPEGGGFWCDPPHQGLLEISDDGEKHLLPNEGVTENVDEPSHMYRAHFHQSDHFNFCGTDDMLGPVVLSAKYYHDSGHVRVILRLSRGTIHQLYESSERCSPLHLAQSVCPDLTLAVVHPVLCPEAGQMILSYDE
jgi:hypothetical protein